MELYNQLVYLNIFKNICMWDMLDTEYGKMQKHLPKKNFLTLFK